MFDIHTAFDVVRSFILSQGDAVCARQSEVSIATSKDGGRDMATNFDIEIEQAFSDLVQQHYPDH